MNHEIRIEEYLIQQIADASGAKHHEILSFFDEQADKMTDVQPNVKGFKPKFGRYQKATNPIWVMRGYYPKTTILFKICIYRFTEDYSVDMYGNPSGTSRDHIKVCAVKPNPKFINIDRNRIREAHAEAMLLGDSNFTIKLKRPRIMTPKGLKPHKLKKSAAKAA